jgi:hypothetical protein
MTEFMQGGVMIAWITVNAAHFRGNPVGRDAPQESKNHRSNSSLNSKKPQDSDGTLRL